MDKLKTFDGVELAFRASKSKRNQKKVCILAHGITAEKTEGGIFNRLAEELNSNGFDTLQFDFRGHGESGGLSKGMTISGEIIDLISVIDYCSQLNYSFIGLVSASFGAVSTSCLPLYFKDLISKLVLWNPVLDLNKTFINPILPWGKASFNTGSFTKLAKTGSLFIDGEFEISAVLINEFHMYKPYLSISEFTVKTLIIHGNKDTYVSYEIAKECASKYSNISFLTIEGSEHGFGRESDEVFAIKETVDFLIN